MEFKVKVRRLFNDETSLKAICSVTLDDQFTVHGVKVINVKNRTFTVMPSEVHKGADGKDVHRDIFHPITSDARKAMEAAVLVAYETAVAESAANNNDTTARA